MKWGDLGGMESLLKSTQISKDRPSRLALPLILTEYLPLKGQNRNFNDANTARGLASRSHTFSLTITYTFVMPAVKHHDVVRILGLSIRKSF